MNHTKKPPQKKNGDFNPHHITKKKSVPSKKYHEKETDNDFHHPHPYTHPHKNNKDD